MVALFAFVVVVLLDGILLLEVVMTSLLFSVLNVLLHGCCRSNLALFITRRAYIREMLPWTRRENTTCAVSVCWLVVVDAAAVLVVAASDLDNDDDDDDVGGIILILAGC